MNRLLAIAVAVLFLAACSPVVASVPAAQPAPTLGAAGQAVLLTATAQALDATAVIVQAQQAQATAEAQATLQAFDGFVLAATEQAIARAATQDAERADLQRQAAAATSTAQVAAVVAQATSDVRSTQRAEQNERAQLAEASANAEALRAGGLIIAVGLAVLLASVAIGKWRWDGLRLAEEREAAGRRRQQQEQMLAMEVLRLAVIESRAGTLFFDRETGRPLVLPPPGPVPAGRSTLASDAPAASAARTIIMNDGGESYSVPPLSPEELEARRQMVEFLEAAISFWGAQGHLQDKIPSSHRYQAAGQSTWGSGDMWQSRRDLFGGWLRSDKKGTWCPQQYPTLGELLEAVRQGQVPACQRR